MIKCVMDLEGHEALRWKELLLGIMDDDWPNIIKEDTLKLTYEFKLIDLETNLKRAEIVAFLLRNANIRKMEFDEWDKGTGLFHTIARAHGVLIDLYDAMEHCPNWIPPPSQPPKGWWQRLKERLW